MAVPYTFGTATAAIPLSNLDSNFATTITLGNTAIQLGNTVTTLNNMTLANVTVSSGNVTVTNITSSSLTSGRVPYATTAGLLTDSSNLLYSGTDLTVYGLTVGRGAGAVASNTAVGASALASNTAGGSNTGAGSSAGGGVTTGNNNVFIGASAGNTTTPITTGSQNIHIGVSTIASASSVSYEHVIGFNLTGKGANTVFIGNGPCYQGNNGATWSVTSDQRLKKNIVDNTIGLSAITQIRVRNFEYRLPEEVTELETHCAIQKEGVQLGVIAQELQAVLPDCVKTESTGVMSVDSDNLTWYFVNAIKEQQAIITSLTARIFALEAK
jgi:hypothetical protein